MKDNSYNNIPEKRECILVVDDEPAILSMISEIIETLSLDCETAESVYSARKIIGSKEINMVISDIRMPYKTGVDFLRWCRETNNEVPFILISGQADTKLITEALNLGARSFLSKPFKIDMLKREINSALAAIRYDKLHKKFVTHLEVSNKKLEDRVRERTIELERTRDVTILSLATLAEIRDPETGNHIERTSAYVKCLAEFLKKKSSFSKYLDDYTIDLLYRSAPLHDIGKVGVPDSILLKPGKLTKEEFEQIKLHTIYGGDTLSRAVQKLGSNSFLNIACDIAYQHHEKWDGSGYPFGRSGEEIAIPARLMALADVYDALVSKRCYKETFSFEKADSIIIESRGKHFDPVVVNAYLKVRDRFREIAGRFSEES